jgi:hypothetical protein
MLTTHPLIVQRLRMSWAIPPLTLWVLLGLLRVSLYLYPVPLLPLYLIYLTETFSAQHLFRYSQRLIILKVLVFELFHMFNHSGINFVSVIYWSDFPLIVIKPFMCLLHKMQISNYVIGWSCLSLCRMCVSGTGQRNNVGCPADCTHNLNW